MNIIKKKKNLRHIENKPVVASGEKGEGVFPSGSAVKNLHAPHAGAAGDMGSIPGFRRSLGGGNGNPLQYSSLENPMDRGAWWAIVHRAAKSRT